MSTELNKRVVTEYFNEYWGKGNVDIVDKLCAEDYLIHYPMHGPRVGRNASKKMLSEFREAFPDLSFGSYGVPLIAEGDYVVGRWIGGGTHSGVAFHDLAVGELDKPNTRKKIYFSGTSIFKLKDGKIVSEIGEEGALTALQQLGIVPGPNPGKDIKYDEGYPTNE
ncbi:hypothetical protein PGUG_02737 [Meyerozyma guilliermondii ATCC 6260]|uniref:SnoaL-like domain-containing protein n=2 Tax=Dikarya TaxID=451864 RepID=A5DHI6_PICGU|nr:uncharacterized protein PGUG_02737 [Meyerozyma guilliermondii ATCC 6260]EDK38639.1 hypothetical protein PGUG_02737 [Meyerozyma guilliermondii ATCC 6260]KAJ9100186.1 hypothetical protein QFC19_005719 [Naganishia cerealis]